MHAGLISFFTGGNSVTSDSNLGLNSQTLALLEAPRNINPAPATGGADITIVQNSALMPDNDPSGGLSENKVNAPSSDQISLYVVRDGDTLSSIAKAFGVSVNTIRWNNNLKDSTISSGDTLTILPITGVRHNVKAGDTVASIAKLYKGDVDEINQYNNITLGTKLVTGDVVIVPDGEMVPVSSGKKSGSVVQFIPSTKVYDGYYIRPTTGPKTQGIHGHNAVDIAPPFGTPIVAAAGGKVIISKTGGWNGGYGTYVVILHPNGTQTLYAHMSKNAMQVGEHADQGEVIGAVGISGEATGPHLHFEVRGARNPF